MKKILALFIALLTFVNVATAQFVTGTYGTPDFLTFFPFKSSSKYSYYQQNYKMSELLDITGQSNDFVINAISLKSQNYQFTYMTRELEIYFVNNWNNYEVTDTSDYLTENDIFDEGRLVYKGSYTFTPGWNKILLDSAFLVNSNAESLTIIVNDITGERFYGDDNIYIGFFATTTSEERSVYSRNDNHRFDISCVPCGNADNSTSSNINYMSFDYSTEIGVEPMYVYYNNSYSQQLYTPQEVGGAKQIESISFYAMNGIEDYRNCTIYLGETDKSEFSGVNDWIDVSNLTQVFDGEVYIDQGWFTIHFTLLLTSTENRTLLLPLKTIPDITFIPIQYFG